MQPDAWAYSAAMNSFAQTGRPTQALEPTILLSYHPTIPSSYDPTIPPPCHLTILLSYHLTILPSYRPTILPPYHPATLQALELFHAMPRGVPPGNH